MKKSLCLFFFTLIFSSFLFAGAFSREPTRYHFDNSGPITICFSPEGGCGALIIEEIEKAKKSVIIAIYSLTSFEISRSLVKAHDRGVNIKIVADSEQADDRYSKIQYLRDNGIPIKLDNHSGKMHDKFAVFDGSVTITGSYNWSKSAENNNDENMIIIENKEIARAFTTEFDRMWKEYK